MSVQVTGLGEDINKEDLEREFGRFGNLIKVWVAVNPPGFAFIDFENDADANKAIKQMDGHRIKGSKITVDVSRRENMRGRGCGRGDGSQSMRSKVDKEMKKNFEEFQKHRGEMFNPGNAGYFVPTMPQAQRSYFPQMAQMRATPRWPAQPQMRPGAQPAAEKIINPGNAGYFVPTMPQAQRSYFPQMAQMRATPRWPAQPQMRPGAQPAAEKIINPGNAGYFVPTMPQAQRSYFPQMAQMRATPRWPAQPQMRPGAQPAAAFQAMQSASFTARATARPAVAAFQNPDMRAGMNAQPITGEQPTAATAAASVTRVAMGPTGVTAARPATMAAANVNPARPAYKYTSNMCNPPQPQTVQQAVTQQAVAQQAVHIQGQEPLTASMLTDANVQEQKQMLGERLFPVIHRWYPDLSDKITGMLLEMNNSELLHMLELYESLKAKTEAPSETQAVEKSQRLDDEMEKNLMEFEESLYCWRNERKRLLELIRKLKEENMLKPTDSENELAVKTPEGKTPKRKQSELDKRVRSENSLVKKQLTPGKPSALKEFKELSQSSDSKKNNKPTKSQADEADDDLDLDMLGVDDDDDDDEEEDDEVTNFEFLTKVVYKPQPDSDIEFFADASSDDDEQNDAEIAESDFWSCPKCNIKNKPTVKYCLTCFQQRCSWLSGKKANMKRKIHTGFNGIQMEDKSSQVHIAENAISTKDAEMSKTKKVNEEPSVGNTSEPAATDVDLLKTQVDILKEIITNIANSLDDEKNSNRNLELEFEKEKNNNLSLKNQAQMLEQQLLESKNETIKILEEKEKIKEDNINMQIEMYNAKMAIIIAKEKEKAAIDAYEHQERVITSLNRNIERLEHDLRRIKLRECDVRIENEKAHQELIDSNLQLHDLSTHISVLQEKETELKKEIERLGNENKNIERLMKEKEDEFIEEMKSMSKNQLKKAYNAERIVEQKEKEADVMRKKIRELKNMIEEKEEEITFLRGKLKELKLALTRREPNKDI